MHRIVKSSILCRGVSLELAVLPFVAIWILATLPAVESVAGEARLDANNFVNLNWLSPDDSSIEAVGVAIAPQTHALDNASMIEARRIRADAVNSTRAIAGDLAVD